ncbi:hypothetical protein BD410DRAFT_751526 [Rickenella mellea]|uniref:Uncharacterized protein n=1 Tax=Rickenella mellea TaxID=50990 RepID=A0A4Y7PWU2_9AGAM|nr:hypothetical protein BD410DRAFT_751526 [Rickenella mellea]
MSTTVLTSTIPTSGVVPLKLAPSSSRTSPDMTATTLGSLYPRAAEAVLHRDFALAHSIIASAFAILHPPTSHFNLPDQLDGQRCKWDILRIILETTVFSAPPTSSDPEAMPAPLRANMMLSAASLIATLYTRSQRLFTPSSSNQKPSVAYLPARMVVALDNASLKIDCPEAASHMTEDWLGKRVEVEHIYRDSEGYEAVVELYSLHVLPRMEGWDQAREFLVHEQELSPKARQRINESLDALQEEANELRRRFHSPRRPPVASPTPSPPPKSRSPSPSPSSSSTSSIDTTSTRTVVPNTPRAKQLSHSLTPMSSISPSPSSILPPPAVTSIPNGTPVSSSPISLPNGSSVRATPLPRAPRADPIPSTLSSSVSLRIPHILAMLQAYIRPYLTGSKVTFVIVLFVFPFLSLLFRLRRGRSRTNLAGSTATVANNKAVDDVRRRLRNREAGRNVLSVVWNEIYRSVADAVRMGGSGLV